MSEIRLRVHDRVRERTIETVAGPATTISELVASLVEEHQLPRRTIRIGRPVRYTLRGPDGFLLAAEGTLTASGLADGAEVELVSPAASRVWGQVVDLWDDVEQDIRGALTEQRDAAVDRAQAQVADVRDRIAGEVEQQARGLVDDLTGGALGPGGEQADDDEVAAAAATGVARGFERRVKDAIRERADEVGDRISGGIEARIEDARARVLDEFNRRLRGRRPTIDRPARLRARRSLARIQRSGTFEGQIDPLRSWLRGLGPMATRGAAAAAGLGGTAAGGVAVGAAVFDAPGEPPAATGPPVTDPVVTEPVVTEPPVTDPPVTEPPVTDPVAEAPPPSLTVFEPRGAPADAFEAPEAFGPAGTREPLVLCLRAVDEAGDATNAVLFLPVTGAPRRAQLEVPPTDPDCGDADGQLTWTPGTVDGPATLTIPVGVRIGGRDGFAEVTVTLRPVVQPGDSLWVIATRLLRAETGDDPTVAEIARCTAALAELNAASNPDPDVIFTGQPIVVPPACR